MSTYYKDRDTFHLRKASRRCYGAGEYNTESIREIENSIIEALNLLGAKKTKLYKLIFSTGIQHGYGSNNSFYQSVLRYARMDAFTRIRYHNGYVEMIEQ